MTAHRRFIPPQAPIEEGAADASLSWPALEHLRNRKQGRQKAELSDWEDEGGSLAEPPPSLPNRLDG